MNTISIVNRGMTPEEIKRMDLGFEEVYLEEGLAMESSDRLSFVALKTSLGAILALTTLSMVIDSLILARAIGVLSTG